MEILKKAKVQYGDWVGTVAADEHQTIGHRHLHEIVGLDEDRWWILAIDRAETEHIHDGFYVYALDRDTTGILNYEQLHARGAEDGTVPVTSFYVHDISFETVIRERFNDYHLQLRSRSLEGLDLAITDRGDLNYHDE